MRRELAAKEALKEANEALRINVTTWIALSDYLDKPYPDDPRWTPWTRFGKRACDAAWQARTKISAALVQSHEDSS